MAMTRDQKGTMVEEITGKLEGAPVVYLTNYSGLTVAQANELRGRFRAAGVEFKVFKNTLVRLAMERMGGYDEVYEHLNGPTAFAFSEEPALPARVLKDYLEDRNLERPELKAAYVGGAVYGADALDVLTKLKSKGDILADILGLLMAPASNLASALGAPASNLAGALASSGSGIASVVQQLAEREG